MNEGTVKILVFLIFAYPVSRLLYKYIFHLLIPFMLNQEFVWNKYIEKPRLLFYFISGVLSLVWWLALSNNPFSDNGIRELAFQIIILLLIFLSSLLQYFTWTKSFAKQLIPAANRIYKRFTTEVMVAIAKDDKTIKRLYKALHNSYIDCSLDSFIYLIKQTPIENNSKIIWIDKVNTRKDLTNKQTLLEFVFQIFPGVYSTKEEQLSRKSLKKIIAEYFVQADNKQIAISDSNINQWQAKNTTPKMKVRKIIKDCLPDK